MKRSIVNLLILALVGTLLLVGCDDTSTVSNPEDAAEYYTLEDIKLPDDFRRPDLIWDVRGIPEATVMPASGEVLKRFSYYDNAGEDARYVVTVTCYLISDDNSEGNSYEPGEYLLEQGWELVRDAGESTTALYAATRAQIDALDPTAIQAYYQHDLLPAVDVRLALQKIVA